MIRFVVIALMALAISGNPAVKGPWRWIHREGTVTPNFKSQSFQELFESLVPQKPTYPTGTIKVGDCGRAPLYSDVYEPAIVNGYETYPHIFPWMVALFIDSIWFCGGSIISDEWIMTAAHCIDGARSIEVVAGAHNIRQAEPSQVTITSTFFFTHENFNPMNFHNDIAMIKLPQRLTFNDYIQPVCLPSSSSSDLGSGAVVNPCGWGSNEYNEKPDTLHAVYLPTITNDECKLWYGNLISEDMICTDGSGGYGTCSGDSGSPLNYKPGVTTEVRGIVSFVSAAGCTARYPTGYARVSHFLGWIQDNTGLTP